MRAHFAHYGHACAVGGETAIHLAAKQAIAEAMWLNLPSVCRPDFLRRCGDNTDQKEILPSRVSRFNEVLIEPDMGGFRPDVQGLFENDTELIEFRVTHAVDYLKTEKIKERNLKCIEVDLRPAGRCPTLASIRFYVLESVDNKHWLWHPVFRDQQLRLDDIEKHQSSIVMPRVTASYTETDDEDVIERELKLKFQQIDREFDEQRARREKEFRQLDTGNKWAQLYEELDRHPSKWPSVLDKKPTVEGFTNANHKLWQGYLFKQFILSALSSPIRAELEVGRIVSWLDRCFGIEFGYRGEAEKAIRDYLNWLVRCRYLRQKLGTQSYLVIRDQL
jgi:hypothetical protein